MKIIILLIFIGNFFIMLSMKNNILGCEVKRAKSVCYETSNAILVA